MIVCLHAEMSINLFGFSLCALALFPLSASVSSGQRDAVSCDEHVYMRVRRCVDSFISLNCFSHFFSYFISRVLVVTVPHVFASEQMGISLGVEKRTNNNTHIHKQHIPAKRLKWKVKMSMNRMCTC